MTTIGRVSEVRTLSITYVLLPILVIFSAQFGFSFMNEGTNTEIGLTYATSIVASAGENIAYQLLTYGSVLVILAVIVFAVGDFRAIASRCRLLLLPGLWAAASGLWSPEPFYSFRRGILLLISTLLAMMLLSRFKPSQLVQLFLMLGLVDSIASLLIVFLAPGVGISHQDASGAWRGLFSHKNTYGIAVTYFLISGYYSVPSRVLASVSRAAVCLLFVFQIIESQARTAWILAIEFFVIAVILALVQKLSRRDVTLLLPSLVLLGGGAVLFLISNLSTIVYSLGKDPTLSGRTEIWAAVMIFILRKPFLGYGFNAFWDSGNAQIVQADVNWQARHAHSGFLEVWLEVGAVGLIILMIILFRASRDLWLCLRQPAPQPRYLRWFAAIIGVTFLCNVDEPTFYVPLALPWLLLMVACGGLMLEADKTKAQIASRKQVEALVEEDQLLQEA